MTHPVSACEWGNSTHTEAPESPVHQHRGGMPAGCQGREAPEHRGRDGTWQSGEGRETRDPHHDARTQPGRHRQGGIGGRRRPSTGKPRIHQLIGRDSRVPPCANPEGMQLRIQGIGLVLGAQIPVRIRVPQQLRIQQQHGIPNNADHTMTMRGGRHSPASGHHQ